MKEHHHLIGTRNLVYFNLQAVVRGQQLDISVCVMDSRIFFDMPSMPVGFFYPTTVVFQALSFLSVFIGKLWSAPCLRAFCCPPTVLFWFSCTATPGSYISLWYGKEWHARRLSERRFLLGSLAPTSDSDMAAGKFLISLVASPQFTRSTSVRERLSAGWWCRACLVVVSQNNDK